MQFHLPKGCRWQINRTVVWENSTPSKWERCQIILGRLHAVQGLSLRIQLNCTSNQPACLHAPPTLKGYNLSYCTQCLVNWFYMALEENFTWFECLGMSSLSAPLSQSAMLHDPLPLASLPFFILTFTKMKGIYQISALLLTYNVTKV